MTTKEELQKLTVNELKAKLKQRGLPMTGAKLELIERLYESIQEEENLLVGNGGLLAEKTRNLFSGAEDLDVDDLLGNSLEPSLTANDEELLLGLSSKPQKTETKPKAPVSALPTAPQVSSKPEISSSKNGTTGDKVAEEPKLVRQPIRPRIEPVEEAKKRRAERFGSTSSTKSIEHTSTLSDSDKHPISLNTSTKLLERAKRFGLPVQTGNDASNGVSKPKVARISSENERDEAKKRRLERFGQK